MSLRHFLEKQAAKTQDDLEVWKQWNANPNKHTTKRLINQFDGLINHSLNQLKAPNTNREAMRLDMINATLDAAKRYDPSKGFALSTYTTNYLNRAKRFNSKNKNIAYIPEERADRIGDIQRAQVYLEGQLNRQPTAKEIAKAVNTSVGLKGKRLLKPNHVSEIQRAAERKDLLVSSFEADINKQYAGKDEETLLLLKPTLTKDEQKVFELIYANKPVTSTGELAKKLNISPSKVSRLKNNIYNQYKRYQ